MWCWLWSTISFQKDYGKKHVWLIIQKIEAEHPYPAQHQGKEPRSQRISKSLLRGRHPRRALSCNRSLSHAQTESPAISTIQVLKFRNEKLQSAQVHSTQYKIVTWAASAENEPVPWKEESLSDWRRHPCDWGSRNQGLYSCLTKLLVHLKEPNRTI